MVRNETIHNILELPIELIELMMSYISYDEIAKMRSVCRAFDSCSQRLLNRGFAKVEKYHSLCFKRVKSQLPRRESERRSHALARHCDVLSAIETRLSLLGMTYMKYVDMSLCCFIPGKVIDEIYRVLRFIQNNPNPPRVHELLQELRDISSMAMEYFEEKIAPSLKSKLSNSNSVMTSVVPLNTSMVSCRSLPSTSHSTHSYSNSKPFTDNELIKSNISLVKQMQQSQNTIKKEFNEMKVKFKDYSTLKRDMTLLKNKLRESDKISNEKEQTIAELKAELEDLKRRMTEYDKKTALKTVKDEQHVQKETKPSKRKLPKNARKYNAKRVRNNNSINEELEEAVMDIPFETMNSEEPELIKTSRTRASKKNIKQTNNTKSRAMTRNAKLSEKCVQKIDTKRKGINKTNVVGKKKQNKRVIKA